jgi:hypothetical protein
MRDESILIVGLETGREFRKDTYHLIVCKELLQHEGFTNVMVMVLAVLFLGLNQKISYTVKLKFS